MDGIITLVILYFVFSLIFKKIKKLNANAGKTQEQTETTVTPPVKPPVAKPKNDFRFPSRPAAPAAPVLKEGREPGAIMREYHPITPSPELKSQFTDYQGSLKAPSSEGIGYQSETYDAIPEPYGAGEGDAVHILPESLTRDTLIQAVVMSEILKRPGVRQ